MGLMLVSSWRHLLQSHKLVSRRLLLPRLAVRIMRAAVFHVRAVRCAAAGNCDAGARKPAGVPRAETGRARCAEGRALVARLGAA